MRILITAGPTREPIDAVRFISNRSSGKLGVALALAAAEADHKVTLLLGPTPVRPPHDGRVTVTPFESSADLEARLAEQTGKWDVLIMAAAVSDYRPAQVAAGKLKRQDEAAKTNGDGGGMTLHLEPTPDLVAAVARDRKPNQRIIAFALEQADELAERAQAKLQRKGVDAIVANPLETMEASTIDPTWFGADGEQTRPGTMPKPLFADWLLARIGQLAAR